MEWDSIQMKPNKGSIDEIDLHNQSSPALPWNVFKCKGSITNLNTLDSFKVRHLIGLTPRSIIMSSCEDDMLLCGC